ncbi:hypothetical protein BaRGS_00009934, partial [Batillaria attramentaria]
MGRNRLLLVVWSFLGVTVIGAQMCPNEWTSFDYSCYIVGTDMVSWTEAEVRNYSSAYGFRTHNKYARTANHVWIGATDIFSEGTFVWLRTFEEVSGFTDWAAGEPNHAHGANSEDCVQMTGEHGWEWNDESCKELSYFVCEKSGAEVWRASRHRIKAAKKELLLFLSRAGQTAGGLELSAAIDRGETGIALLIRLPVKRLDAYTSLHDVPKINAIDESPDVFVPGLPSLAREIRHIL